MLSFSRDPQTQIYRRIDDFPRNKGIFIPLMSVIVSKCETTQNLTNVASLDQSSIDTPTLELELDLNLLKLGDINRYRINAGQIKEFDVQFPKNQNDAIFPLTSGSGPCEAIAAGRYIWTEPLEAGTHYVYFRGNLRCPQPGPVPPVSCIDSSYHEDIIYRIHVP
jgi:hypothetical protein